MKKIYFTITGTNHRYGMKFFEPKQEGEVKHQSDGAFDDIKTRDIDFFHKADALKGLEYPCW